jgi:hypothetical protein
MVAMVAQVTLRRGLDPRGLATDEGIDRQMRAADIDAATTRDSSDTVGFAFEGQ